MSRLRSLRAFLVPLLAVGALYAAFGSFQAYDYDLPLHLITGEHILEDFAAAETNQFSFTYPGYEWLNDKWMENVLVHLVDRAGGAAGLVGFRLALVLGLGALLGLAMGAGMQPSDPWRLPAILLLLALPVLDARRALTQPCSWSVPKTPSRTCSAAPLPPCSE